MMRTAFVAAFVLAVFLAVPAHAANHYVRAGASGANNGNDWTNAFPTLPAALIRGDTYYIADGSYGGYTFDDALSGTAVITVKKAVAGDQYAFGEGRSRRERSVRGSRLEGAESSLTEDVGGEFLLHVVALKRLRPSRRRQIELKWTPSFGPILKPAKRGLCAWVMRPDEHREVVVGRRLRAVACFPAEAKAKPERRRPVHAATRGKQPLVFVLRAPCAVAFR